MFPSLSDLNYFLEVCQVLNLSRAAERLGVSQPTLSLAIRRLEKCLNAEVIIRNKNGVKLTQEGKQLGIQAKKLLETWGKIKASTTGSMDKIQGSFVIGCHPSVALYSLPGVLPGLIMNHPNLNINLKHDLSRKIVEEVISSTIDIGIVVNPNKHPDLVIHTLCYDEVALWTAKKSPLLSGHSANEREFEVLICDPNLLQIQSILKSLKKMGVLIRRIIGSSSLEVIAKLAANSCGVGILPTRVAQCYTDLELVKFKNTPVFRDEICLIYRVENKSVQTIKTISQTLRAYFKNDKN